MKNILRMILAVLIGSVLYNSGSISIYFEDYWKLVAAMALFPIYLSVVGYSIRACYLSIKPKCLLKLIFQIILIDSSLLIGSYYMFSNKFGTLSFIDDNAFIILILFLTITISFFSGCGIFMKLYYIRHPGQLTIKLENDDGKAEINVKPGWDLQGKFRK